MSWLVVGDGLAHAVYRRVYVCTACGDIDTVSELRVFVNDMGHAGFGEVQFLHETFAILCSV